jgi:cysteine-rich repeat protein
MLSLVAGMAGCGSNDGGGSAGAGGSDAGDASGGVGGDAAPDVSAACGNGVLEGDEVCDNGPNNAPGSGCEPDCTPSCSTNAACDDGEPCNGTETCAAGPGGGRVCEQGTPLAEGATCGQGRYCKSNVCISSSCGNGSLEPGEGCDPPDGTSCSDDCQLMVCGDGKIVGTEHCDDGNLLDHDGCDSKCRYETIMRFTWYEIRNDAGPAFCTYQGNALGASLAGAVTAALSSSVNEATEGGASNLLIRLGGLEDLSGENASTLDMSMISGKLHPDYVSQWTPNAIDGWFVSDPDMLDPAGKPLNSLGPASISARLLTSGPGLAKMRVVAGTTTSLFEIRDTRIRALVLDSPSPDIPKPPPNALRPGVAVFRTLDAAAADRGLCGGVTLASLAEIVLPQDFSAGDFACSDACSNSRKYTYCGPGQPVGPSCNSLLDLLVGGCRTPGCFFTAATPTQPDIGSDGNPPAGVTLGANNKAIVTSPTDAYSFSIRFKANRAHLTDNLP